LSLGEAQSRYGPLEDEKFPIPAVDLDNVDSKYLRSSACCLRAWIGPLGVN
jgi:hypothetical protein